MRAQPSSPVVQSSAETSPLNRERLEANLLYYVANPRLINQRLHELDREWSIERLLEANAAALAGAGTLMGLLRGKYWLLLPAGATGFLMQHAVQGWCAPMKLFHQMGFRPAEEIDEERYALKILRGDLEPVKEADVDDMVAEVERAMAAAEG